MEFTLTSRSIVELRTLTVDEINIMMEETNEQNKNKIIIKYLQKSIVKVIKSTYKEFKLNKLISPDIIDLLLIVRKINFEDFPYLFEQKCNGSDSTCKNRKRPFTLELDLDELLAERTFLSEEGQKILANGNVIESDSPLGKMTWHIPTIADENKAKEIAKEYSNGLQVLLMSVVDKIEGVEPNDLFNKLGKLKGNALMKMASTVQQFECGFMGDVSIECPECKADWAIKLPFSIQAFLPENQLMLRYKKLQREYKGSIKKALIFG